jgi:hypothetical protein
MASSAEFIRQRRRFMANITRFSPIDEAFDELFRGFFVRPISVEGQNTPAQFRVDGA